MHTPGSINSISCLPLRDNLRRKSAWKPWEVTTKNKFLTHFHILKYIRSVQDLCFYIFAHIHTHFIFSSSITKISLSLCVMGLRVHMCLICIYMVAYKGLRMTSIILLITLPIVPQARFSLAESKLWPSSCHCSHNIGVTDTSDHVQLFYIDAGDLNSAPYSCIVSEPAFSVFMVLGYLFVNTILMSF